MPSYASVCTDKRFNGVCVRVTDLDDRGVPSSSASVVYTPALARELAREILIEADKVDALGGPTATLSTLCKPAARARSGS